MFIDWNYGYFRLSVVTPYIRIMDFDWLITSVFSYLADFPKRAEKLSVIRTDRHEDLVRPKNILPVRKKKPQKIHCHVHNV